MNMLPTLTIQPRSDQSPPTELSAASVAYLLGSNDLGVTHELELIHAKAIPITCSCSASDATVHLRKSAGKILPVNHPIDGVHHLRCPLYTKVKGVDIRKSGISHKTIAERFLRTTPFSRQPAVRTDRPLFKRWPEAIEAVENELPILFSLVTFTNETTSTPTYGLSAGITNDLKRIPSDSEIIGLTKTLKNGPWITLAVTLNGTTRSFVQPVFKFDRPLALRHEGDRRKMAYALSKLKPPANAFISAPAGGMFVKGRRLTPTFFIHHTVIEAVYVADGNNIGKIMSIKKQLDKWKPRTLIVRVVEVGSYEA